LGSARSGASQVWRFVNEIQKGDWVITYSPANRTYLLGKVTSDFQYHPELMIVIWFCVCWQTGGIAWWQGRSCWNVWETLLCLLNSVNGQV
jgi:predicted Mrr-cat superfamily restriction endonuclease